MKAGRNFYEVEWFLLSLESPYCSLRRSNRFVSSVLITVPYNKV